MKKIIFILLVFIINWAPSGNYDGGDISPNNNNIILIKSNIGILNISSGDWELIDIDGLPLIPAHWEGNSELIAFALETDSGFIPVIYDVNSKETSYGPAGSKIRELNWDDNTNKLLVVIQNQAAAIQCSIYVITYSSVSDSLVLPITVSNKFPARDGNFLDGNILCLAGNHFPSIRAETIKPYTNINGWGKFSIYQIGLHC